MKASGGFEEAFNLNGKPVSDKDLARLEESFRAIADSIAVSRKLMADIAEKEAGQAILGQVKSVHNMVLKNTQFSMNEDKADVENALAALFNGVHPIDFDDHLRSRLADHFGIDGWTAAGVLACLLRYPGQYIPHEGLAKAAGVQSTRSGVIRVYVCQIRSSLEDKGLPGESIETGRGSYRIVRSAAFEIINAIGRSAP